MSDPTFDRSIGALLGLAIDDTLGAPFGGLDRYSYPPVADYSDAGVGGIDAVARQLAGASFGASAIPPRSSGALRLRPRLAELARRLHERSALR